MFLLVSLFVVLVASSQVHGKKGRLSLVGLVVFKQLGFEQNSAVSPLNLGTALAMASGGALGETKARLQKLLGCSLAQCAALALSRTALEMANHVFARDKEFVINKAFAHAMSELFNAEVVNVDFSAAQETCKIVNKWVAEATHNKITEIVSPETAMDDVVVLLVSALYFKAQWKTKFETTRHIPFRMASKGHKMVDAMKVVDSFRHANTDEAEMIEIPYHDERFAMLVVVPHEDSGVFSGLIPDDLERWDAQLTPQLVSLTMPVFHFASPPLDLMNSLRALGLEDMFANGDYDGVGSGAGRITISHIYHKVVVDVDKVGTEASAATAVVMELEMALVATRNPIEMVVNRAFLYFIRDTRTKEVLIAGHVNSPHLK